MRGFVTTDSVACLHNHRYKSDRTFHYGPQNPTHLSEKAHFLVIDSAETWHVNQVGLHSHCPGTIGQQHIGASVLPIPVKAAFEVTWIGPTLHNATFRQYFLNGIFF